MGTKNLYTHLTPMKRGMFQGLASQGLSNIAIAKQLGVSQSTVSRELLRNCPSGTTLSDRKKSYSAENAQARYEKKRKNSRPYGKCYLNVVKTAEKCLKKSYSPEQIANSDLKGIVSHMTLYRWMNAGLLFYGDKSYLRLKGRKRSSRTDLRHGRYSVGKSIDSRGPEINSREEFGHYEVDSIMSGRDGGHCVFTFVERKTRMIFAFLADGCTADNFFKVLIRLWRKLPKGAIKSLTGDRGKEFARYGDIERIPGIPFYFADPHSPWQKGTNENSNGLIREEFPKGTDFSKVTQAELNRRSINPINKRPRKSLDWQKAQDCFRMELSQLS